MKWLLCLLVSACAVPSKTEGWCLPKRSIRTLGLMSMLVFGATFSNAQEVRVDKDCSPEAATCTIVGPDLFALLANNNKGWEIATALRERVLELRAEIEAMKKSGPKCAELEVVPKHDAPTLAPKKLVPPIKREQNS